MRRESDNEKTTTKPHSGVAKTAAVIGIVAGLIGLFTAGVAGIEKVSDYVVSRAELQIAKKEVIDHIHKEAVITREVIVGEILIRKAKLNDQLEDAETEGEIARILQHIKELNTRLDKIRGVGE